MFVENIYGRWKGCFCRFLKCVDFMVNFVIVVIVVLCVIYNICELRRDNFLVEWLVGVGDIGYFLNYDLLFGF